jgi:plastocyanin
MIRRAGLAAAFLLLLSSSNVAAASHVVTMTGHGYVPKTLTIALCDTVQWDNTSRRKHTATPDLSGLWSPVVVKRHSTSAPLAFTQAGTLAYHSTVGRKMHGSIAVAPSVSPSSGDASTTFTLTVACASTPGQFAHEIQVRRNGGAWEARPWTEGQAVGFQSSLTGTWEFRTRMRYLLKGSTTGWSPIVSIQIN